MLGDDGELNQTKQSSISTLTQVSDSPVRNLTHAEDFEFHKGEEGDDSSDDSQSNGNPLIDAVDRVISSHSNRVR